MEEDFSTMDDTQLTARVAAGDERAIAVLYDRYSTPAFSLALKLAGDPQRAGDLVQRAFTRVWQDARRFDPQTGRFANWLLSLVNYLATRPAPLAPAPLPAPSRPAHLCLAPITIRTRSR